MPTYRVSLKGPQLWDAEATVEAMDADQAANKVYNQPENILLTTPYAIDFTEFDVVTVEEDV